MLVDVGTLEKDDMDAVNELKKRLDNEIKENRRRFKEAGLYKDDYAPLEIFYSCPFDVIKTVMVENPEYFAEWPLLLGILPKEIIKAAVEKNPEMLDYWHYYDENGARVPPPWLPDMQ